MLTTTPKGQATSSCQQDSEARLTSRSSLKILKIIGVFYFCCDTRIVHISPTFLIMDWDLHPFVAFSNVDSVRQRYHECCLKSMCIMSYMCVEIFFKPTLDRLFDPIRNRASNLLAFAGWISSLIGRHPQLLPSLKRITLVTSTHLYVTWLHPFLLESELISALDCSQITMCGLSPAPEASRREASPRSNCRAARGADHTQQVCI